MTIKIGKVPCYGKQIKVWGWTQSVAISDIPLHVAYASINEGGYSSKHYHQDLTNRFIVISGKLRIDIWRNDKEETVDLHAGDIVDIEAGVPHRMTAITYVQLIEIYWSNKPELNAEDIVREDNGGIKDKSFCISDFILKKTKAKDFTLDTSPNINDPVVPSKTFEQPAKPFADVWCNHNDLMEHVDGY